MTSRRKFIQIVPLAGAAALVAGRVQAAPPPKATESDPQAAALGYKEDASKVDTAKFKNYVKGSNCSSCALYQGKPTDATAPCAALGGKLVVAKGWCSAYAKKA